MKSVLSVLMFTALGASAPAIAIAPQASGSTALPLTEAGGGMLLDPMVVGDPVHVASGRIATTWDYSDPALDGVEFDPLHVYSRHGGEHISPRVVIGNLALNPVQP